MRKFSTLLFAATFAACAPKAPIATQPVVDERAQAVAAFETVRKVLQHPRCQNCHIPGDAPLQFDIGLPHQMAVLRGPEGKGAFGLPCSTCHGEANPPAAFGPNAPPGALNWHLPPPQHKMVFINLSSAELCRIVKNRDENGGKDFDALIKHVAEDGLVLWGWKPGGVRAPVSVPHAEFVAAFKRWAAAGGPCPGDQLANATMRTSAP